MRSNLLRSRLSHAPLSPTRTSRPTLRFYQLHTQTRLRHIKINEECGLIINLYRSHRAHFSVVFRAKMFELLASS